MNWADSQIQEYSEKAKEQQPYGSRITLLFGLTMVSFFIVTYMTINNFAFRYAFRHLLHTGLEFAFEKAVQLLVPPSSSP